MSATNIDQWARVATQLRQPPIAQGPSVVDGHFALQGPIGQAAAQGPIGQAATQRPTGQAAAQGHIAPAAAQGPTNQVGAQAAITAAIGPSEMMRGPIVVTNETKLDNWTFGAGIVTHLQCYQAEDVFKLLSGYPGDFVLRVTNACHETLCDGTMYSLVFSRTASRYYLHDDDAPLHCKNFGRKVMLAMIEQYFGPTCFGAWLPDDVMQKGKFFASATIRIAVSSTDLMLNEEFLGAPKRRRTCKDDSDDDNVITRSVGRCKSQKVMLMCANLLDSTRMQNLLSTAKKWRENVCVHVVGTQLD